MPPGALEVGDGSRTLEVSIVVFKEKVLNILFLGPASFFSREGGGTLPQNSYKPA